MTSTELALAAPTQAVSGPPSPMEWRAMREQAEVIAASGLAPRAVNTREKVLVIALKGRELSIPPMQALAHVHVIDGKPTMSAELMVALVQRAGHRIRVVETSAQQCVVEGERADDPGRPSQVTWSMDDARTAGLVGKGPWTQYPAAMLRARAISSLCRFQFADVLMGVSYTPEELGVDVDEDGNVIRLDGQDTNAYLAEDHQTALGELEEVIARIPDGMPADLDKARAYADQSTAHARKAIEKLTDAIARHQAADVDDQDAVDAEVVDDTPTPDLDDTAAPPVPGDVLAAAEDDTPSASPAAAPPTDDLTWRELALEAGVQPIEVLKTLIDVWPRNDMAARPNRLGDIDRLCDSDPDGARRVGAVIDRLAQADRP